MLQSNAESVVRFAHFDAFKQLFCDWVPNPCEEGVDPIIFLATYEPSLEDSMGGIQDIIGGSQFDCRE